MLSFNKSTVTCEGESGESSRSVCHISQTHFPSSTQREKNSSNDISMKQASKLTVVEYHNVNLADRYLKQYPEFYQLQKFDRVNNFGKHTAEVWID